MLQRLWLCFYLTPALIFYVALDKNTSDRKLHIICLDIPEHVDDENKNVSAKKAAAAAERRARIMKQIAAQQSHFMKVKENFNLI